VVTADGPAGPRGPCLLRDLDLFRPAARGEGSPTQVCQGFPEGSHRGLQELFPTLPVQVTTELEGSAEADPNVTAAEAPAPPGPDVEASLDPAGDHGYAGPEEDPDGAAAKGLDRSVPRPLPLPVDAHARSGIEAPKHHPDRLGIQGKGVVNITKDRNRTD